MRTTRDHLCMLFMVVAACRVGGSEERTLLAPTHTGMLRLYVSGSRGLGEPSETWRKVTTAAAASTEVVRYDRAGLGASPAGEAVPRTAAEIASELHDALVSASINPPYVLVSHSAGAWYVIVFAAQHLNEVKALVLIDPTPPNFFSE